MMILLIGLLGAGLLAISSALCNTAAAKPVPVKAKKHTQLSQLKR